MVAMWEKIRNRCFHTEKRVDPNARQQAGRSLSGDSIKTNHGNRITEQQDQANTTDNQRKLNQRLSLNTN